MNDDDLITFVTGFREGLLEDRRSGGMCFAVCSPLSTLLRLHGVENEIVESRIAHWFLRLPDGRVLDPTADQFGMEEVYLGEPCEVHQ